MNIAAYCRVSTDKADQLNSLEAQKEFFSEYTKRTGDTLVRLYADEGISGTKIKNRKEFLRMMADAEHGLFDMVVVKDISRFARNTVDLLQNVRKLKSLGIETQFLTANMTSMGNSEFVLTIFGALAQEESANTSKRVKFGKKMNAEKGRVPNIVYGYDKTIGDYFNLAINEEEAAVVRQIYEWYIKDGYGAAKISIFLNERGLRTKRNCQWSQNGVCRILTNELYTGKIINGKQEVTDFLTGQRADKDETEWMVVERPDLRIIEPEVFKQAQQIMQSRGKAFKVDKERQSNKYLFSTLIKCKECGWSFRRTVRTYKNTYVRWVCSGHNGRGADNCPNAVTVDEEELIEVLQEYFAELLKAKKNVIRYVVGEFQRVYKAKDENLNYEKELNAQLAKLQKTRQKYMDMYADDLISREELNDKIGGMRKEIERLENELKMVAYHLTKGEQLESVLGRTFKEIEDITDVHQMTNAQLKRIIQKIEVDKDGNVDIYLRLLGDLGLDETVLIHHDETQGRFGAAAQLAAGTVCAGAGRAGPQQGRAASARRCGHPAQVLPPVNADGCAPAGACPPFLLSGMELRKCAFFQPGYLRLTDADLPGHLHLRFALQVAQLHDPLLPRGQLCHRLAELQPADPAVLAVWVPHLIDDVHGIAAVAVDRLFQTDRLHHRLQRGGHFPAGQSGRSGDLVHGRLPAKLLFQCFAALHGAVCGVAQAAADPKGVVVPQKAPDLADDHRHAVGGKPHRLGGVKVVDGLDQPNAPYLKQVIQIFAPLGEPLHHTEDQPQVAFHHLLPGLPVAAAGLNKEPTLFVFGQDRQLRGVQPAEFDFVVHPHASRFYFTGSMACGYRRYAWKKLCLPPKGRRHTKAVVIGTDL